MNLSPSADDPSHDELEMQEYLGETKPRIMQVAVLTTLVCPGVGYMYIGRMVKGLTINFLMILMLEAFVIAWTLLNFFPLLPFIVVALAWVTFSVLAALDVRQILEEEGTEDYLLQSFNHPIMYVLAGIFSFIVPMVMTYSVTIDKLWMFSPVRHDGMYPTLLHGDIVLIDRDGYAAEPPARGDVVAVWLERPTERLELLRVVGAPGDIVRIEGDLLYLNDEPMEQFSFEASEPIAGLGNRPEDIRIMVERNQEARYVISQSMQSGPEVSVPTTQLGASEPSAGLGDQSGDDQATADTSQRAPYYDMFLLSDNRTQRPITEQSTRRIYDSRHHGVIDANTVRGRPQFIIWSQDPDSGRVRWDRIGWRVQ